MSSIVFGSPEAAAVLQQDRTIAELEDAAIKNADGGFWVLGMDLTPEQRKMVRRLVADGMWEDNADCDPDFRDYRPNKDERERLVAIYTERRPRLTKLTPPAYRPSMPRPATC